MDAGHEAQQHETHLTEGEIRDIEDDLRDGPIDHVSEDLQLPGAHKGKRRVRMASGRICVAKPEGAVEEWEHAAACEGAAYMVARQLGLAWLVPVTMVRKINLAKGEVRLAALQLWRSPGDEGRLDEFPEEEVTAAAVFDYLIEQGDRDGRNWMTLRDRSGPPHLLLFDNGCAFGGRGWPLKSTFYELRRRHQLDGRMLAALQRLRDRQFGEALATLLPRELIGELLERAERLIDGRRLP